MGAVAFALVLHGAAGVRAQAPSVQTEPVQRIDLPVGRSYAITTASDILRASVAAPEVADAIVVSPREVVVNAKAPGETDILVWPTGVEPQHYRVLVHSPADRMQVLVSVKFAEVRRDALTDLGISALYHHNGTRIGTGDLKNDLHVDPVTGKAVVPSQADFLTILTDFGTKDFEAMLQAQEEKGNARLLAEPNIMAGNKEDASFLAGGEIPIPIAQGAVTGAYAAVTIDYREYGIRLHFNAEIVSDSLIKLKIQPEVSTLDYSNAIVLAGFRIPALRTRRVQSVLDVRRDQSLVISGLFDDEREQVRTGIPYLQDIPILGALFSSTQWQHNETELVVIVTPVIVDPMHPRPEDVRVFPPDTRRPAQAALSPDTTSGVKPPM